MLPKKLSPASISAFTFNHFDLLLKFRGRLNLLNSENWSAQPSSNSFSMVQDLSVCYIHTSVTPNVFWNLMVSLVSFPKWWTNPPGFCTAGNLLNQVCRDCRCSSLVTFTGKTATLSEQTRAKSWSSSPSISSSVISQTLPPKESTNTRKKYQVWDALRTILAAESSKQHVQTARLYTMSNR